MARNGLNCRLSYRSGGGAVTHAYRLRCKSISHGMTVVGTESSARVKKVFYPHKLSFAPFSITVDLIGEDEFNSFTDWMTNYIDVVFSEGLESSTFPYMLVEVEARGFNMAGIPLNGYDRSDAAGRMIWSPTINFHTVADNREGMTDQRSFVSGINSENRYYYPTKDAIPETWASLAKTLFGSGGDAGVLGGIFGGTGGGL